MDGTRRFVGSGQVATDFRTQLEMPRKLCLTKRIDVEETHQQINGGRSDVVADETMTLRQGLRQLSLNRSYPELSPSAG
jgi:hypothetical protein